MAPWLWADDHLVATIGEQEVTRGALLATAAQALDENEMARLRCQVEADRGHHEVLEASLRELVRRRLLEREAERTGTTVAAVQARIQDTAQPISDEDVEQFYERNKARIRDPFANVAGQIRTYLERQALRFAQNDFFALLEDRFAVEYLLQPLRFAVATDGFAATGPADAPVTLVEFSDFECPFCARFLPTLTRAKEEYAGRLRVVFRHYPLTGIHPHAQKAAEASLCAGDQGKFWEMHDLMFAEQGALSVPALKEKAGRLGLDQDTFDRCLDSNRHYETVRNDLRAGTAVGVSGTPALFVNGRFLSGAVPFESLAAIIDDELARQENS
jgi:protein-disulfide isomerase